MQYYSIMTVTPVQCNTTIIKMADFTKSSPQVNANDHVSLGVWTVTIHCVLGENGAGMAVLAEM